MHKAMHQLRRQFLLRAHNTELWASYRPEVPGRIYLPATIGLSLIAGALTGKPTQRTRSRAVAIITGTLLCLPLVMLTRFARQNRTRRAAVRQQMLDAVSWRGDEAVLDVGCGSGMLLNGAAGRLQTGTALGIDIWADHGGGGNLALLMKHARQENVADRITFQEVDARRMPFEDGSFDVVLSSWALHHISRSGQDFEDTVGEILRVLKPGGTMVILDTAHMLEALVIRMEKAGLQVKLQETPRGQKFVVGRRI